MSGDNTIAVRLRKILDISLQLPPDFIWWVIMKEDFNFQSVEN